MQAADEREKVHVPSGDSTCAAWWYPGTNGACVIMAAGLGVTKEPGTDRFASRFHAAGFTVLAFDYRHLGASGGQPRVDRTGAGNLPRLRRLPRKLPSATLGRPDPLRPARNQ